MAGLVIDASVAVKWFIDEDRAAAALKLRRSREELIAPDIVVFEVFSAVWAAVRKKRISREKLDEVAPLIPAVFSALIPATELYQTACRLASRYDHPIYDTLFLTLAQRESCALVTADERLFAVARKARISATLL